MTATRSQNGWTVIRNRDRLREWNVPSEAGPFVLPLQSERAGFLLCHYALWHSEVIEPVDGGGDDFGWALRKIAGSDQWSNHASGTAIDLNASAHPSGVRGTFSGSHASRIRLRLSHTFDNMIRWGGDFHTTVDEMHFEIAAPSTDIRPLVADLITTERGIRIIEANPDLGKWADE